MQLQQKPGEGEQEAAPTREYLGSGIAGAVFSPCRSYRYSLWRRWNVDAVAGVDCSAMEMVAFIGLNPSTATEYRDDPTIRRCIRFAKDWGFSGLVMLNAFAYRATDPREMKLQDFPEGPENMTAIAQICREVGRVCCCWGTHGRHRGQAGAVLDVVGRESRSPCHCLGKTADGSPKHPLYLSRNTPLIPY